MEDYSAPDRGRPRKGGRARRTNELIARIEDGLVHTDIRDAGLTGLDLALTAFVP